MAIITEEAELEPQTNEQTEPTSPSKNPKTKPRAKPKEHTKETQTKRQTQSRSNPFEFWFYFTVSVSLITLLTAALSSLYSSTDPKSFFLSLPSPLRHHYSKGRTIKVQLEQNQKPVEVFALESGNKHASSEKVVMVHGLGLSSFSYRKVVDFLGTKGVHGVVFDLPGNGFSDKSMEVMEERGNGLFEKLLDVYGLIKEKGVFWAFDVMVETGEVPYAEIQSHFDKKKSVVRPIMLSNEKAGKVLGQVIETLGLAPVHLVLHDSSLGMVANWILKNSELVRSVTLVDTGSRPALPLFALQMPVVREVLLGLNFAYERLISLCCSKGIGGSDLEAHRVLLSGMDGRRAVVGTGMGLNTSFDVAEWSSLDGVKGLPMQIIWSNTWSKEWTEEGRKVAKALPQAKFLAHSGGRWPEEDAVDELAQEIVNFVSSLPKSVRQTEEEPIPEHIQKMLDEAKANEHHHHHHHGHGHAGHGHDHGHAHIHAPGYMDAYGLGGHGWGG
ncbi:hypothetical protein Tsubulata_046042 [Turnera subulata]|uniref:AB hydrolase-1 domain-containing protein n=1 Tax=Turnera subulata TaxID=218843 RepID=A0A9Q0GKX0_9ROSI|nr:hypothetical protein Tsubulata_046042 [Turnera subulata]